MSWAESPGPWSLDRSHYSMKDSDDINHFREWTVRTVKPHYDRFGFLLNLHDFLNMPSVMFSGTKLSNKGVPVKLSANPLVSLAQFSDE